MKWFYGISLLVVAVLALFPVFLLSGDTREHHTGAMVYRLTYSADVKSIDPATCGDDMSLDHPGELFRRALRISLSQAAGRSGSAACRVHARNLGRRSYLYDLHLKPGVLYHRNPCFGRDPTGRHAWSTRTVAAADFVLAFKRVADYHINTGLAWAFFQPDRRARCVSRKNPALQDRRFFAIRSAMSRVCRRSIRSRCASGLSSPFPQFIYVLAMQSVAPVPREVIDYWLTTESDGHGGRRPLAVHERNPEIMPSRGRRSAPARTCLTK